MNQSEVARLREQIELQIEAMQRGMHGFSTGATRHAFIRARLERLGLRTRHVGVLMALSDCGPLSQQALGSLLRIDPATMVSTITDLEVEGLVKRGRDSGDARRHAVTITPSGAARLQDAEAILDALDDEILVALSPRQQHGLHEALKRLAEAESVRRMVDQARLVPSADR